MTDNLEAIRKKLRLYLGAYWLRPSTAVWRVCDWLEVSKLKFNEPFMDMACGDGLNTFLLFDNELPLDIDDSLSTKPVNPVDFFEEYVDIYNVDNGNFPQLPQARNRVAIGMDWKQGLLDKAHNLSFYEQLILHDANNPLPLEDESIGTIFSNSIYWLENVEGCLGQIHRKLKPGGNAVLLIANPNMAKYNIYNLYQTKWSKTLDRGRHRHYKSLFDKDHWMRLFEKTGFEVSSFASYIPPKLTLTQEIGLRPISPVLIQMANALDSAKRMEIKKQWIDYMEYICMPFFEEEYFTEKHQDNCYYIFNLQK